MCDIAEHLQAFYIHTQRSKCKTKRTIRNSFIATQGIILGTEASKAHIQIQQEERVIQT